MHWNNWQKLQEFYLVVNNSPVVTIHTTQTVQSSTQLQNIQVTLNVQSEICYVLQILNSDSPDGRLLHFPVGSAIASSGSNLFFIIALK